MANNMKRANHHWWPQCVSKRWFNNENKIYQLFFDERYIPPHTITKNFGAIGNAHTIKFSLEKPTDWDETFEGIFNDGLFPNILNWLEGLKDNFDPLEDEQANLT